MMESAYKELIIYYNDGQSISKSVPSEKISEFLKWFSSKSDEKFCLEEHVQEIPHVADAVDGIYLERKDIKSYEISKDPKFDDTKLVF